MYYIIPTIRRYMASALKEQGMAQKEIAHLFGVRESTVSQYFSSKRASLVTFPENVVAEIERSTHSMKTGFDMIREVQRLLKVVRETRVLCDVHKKYSGITAPCEPFAMGCLPYMERA